ncbi:hypothetical protein XELAEV_18000602mg [Xenopus laevis]|nr:hypothetical protein XELAEV_18000602mg [Xenopus laevis]
MATFIESCVADVLTCNWIVDVLWVNQSQLVCWKIVKAASKLQLLPSGVKTRGSSIPVQEGHDRIDYLCTEDTGFHTLMRCLIFRGSVS